MGRRAVAPARVGLERRFRELPLSIDAVAGCTRRFVVGPALSDLFLCEAGTFDGAARIDWSARRAEGDYDGCTSENEMPHPKSAAT